MNAKFDENNQSIRSLIRDVNNKINRDLNFKGSPKTSRQKNTRKSVEKCTGSQSRRKYNDPKRDDIHIIKGNFLVKINLFF
jgi:hypothetical protein